MRFQLLMIALAIAPLAGEVFAVMNKGEQVKSQQTGFGIELPATEVGKITILSTFGTNESNETYFPNMSLSNGARKGPWSSTSVVVRLSVLVG